MALTAPLSSLAASSTANHSLTNLTRLLARQQKILSHPDEETERKLRRDVYFRRKVGQNLDLARTLLLRLEQDAAGVKVLSRRQVEQAELMRKRDGIEWLSEKLEAWEEIAAAEPHDDHDVSEGEDLLGDDDTPSEDVTESEESEAREVEKTEARDMKEPQDPALQEESSQASQGNPLPESISTERDQLFPSTLRLRHNQPTSAAEPNTDTATSTATEHMLTHNRTEQENLTASLLSMATALKESSKAFNTSLESEKEVLARAGEGLEKNVTGVEQAQRRMGFLRSMSEGKGWLGRMIMYVWIFGMWFVALFIVFAMPKLRF